MMELSNGPWKNLFKGNWENYEIEVKQNPRKILLTLIYEKSKAGVISTVNKFYYTDSNPSKLMSEFKDYSLTIGKSFPTHESNFFSLSSGLNYSSLELLNELIEKEFKEIEVKTEQLNEKIKEYSLDLIELNHVSEEKQKDLLADPVLLLGILTNKGMPGEPLTSSVKVLLGKTLKGEEAAEEIDSFKNTLIFGSEGEVEKAIHLMLENLVLSGKIGIVFDENNSFSRMNYPNKEFDFEKYKELQPIGMPVKSVAASEVGIDLKKLSSKMLLEAFCLDSENFIGEKTNQIITSIFEKHKQEINSLDDLETKVMEITDETKKYHVYRAVRWLRVLEKKYPDYFKGSVSYKKLIPSYSTSMGKIVRIEVEEEPKQIRKALAYSLISNLKEDYKKKNYSNNLKVMLCLPDGRNYFPSAPKKEVEDSLISEAQEALNYGIGFAVGAESEEELSDAVVEKSSLKIDFVSKQEIAFMKKEATPYRIKIRENLTS